MRTVHEHATGTEDHWVAEIDGGHALRMPRNRTKRRRLMSFEPAVHVQGGDVVQGGPERAKLG